MVLNVDSETSYLSAPNACSHATRYYLLGSITRAGQPIKINGATGVLCTVLHFVTASAAEAELRTLFLNVQKAKMMRLTMEEWGHSQPPTPIHINNLTTVGINNNTIKRQKS